MSIYRNGVRVTMDEVSSDYADLTNKPVVNGTELNGNMTITTDDIVAVTSLPTTDINQKKFYMYGTSLYWCSDTSIPKWEIISNGGQTVQSIVNSMHPVGSIYISASNTDPGTLFGGTWVAIHNVFLAAAGSTFTAGKTGGATTATYTPKGTNSGGAYTFDAITLSVSNLPPHTHTYTPVGNVTVKTYPTFTGTQVTSGEGSASISKSLGSHYHACYFNHTNKGGTDTNTLISYSETKNGTKTYTYTSSYSGVSVSASGHTHNYKATGAISGGEWTFTNGGEITSSSTGSGASFTPTTASVTQPTFTGTQTSFSTMPPYTAVYMWRRTS